MERNGSTVGLQQSPCLSQEEALYRMFFFTYCTMKLIRVVKTSRQNMYWSWNRQTWWLTICFAMPKRLKQEGALGTLLLNFVLGYAITVFLKQGSVRGRQGFRDTKMLNGGWNLLAVQNLYVRIKIRVAIFDTNHSITPDSFTGNLL